MSKESRQIGLKNISDNGEDGCLTLDIYQTDEDIVIKSTIAGVKPEDLDVSVSNDSVTIKGYRRQEEKIEEDNYYYQELHWGSFSRSVLLPEEIDPDIAKASLVNGILTLKLPKMSRKKIKKIKVLG